MLERSAVESKYILYNTVSRKKSMNTGLEQHTSRNTASVIRYI